MQHRVRSCDIGEEPIAPLFAGAAAFTLVARADIVPFPSVYFRSNVDGAHAVVEASRAAEGTRLVYAVSSSCYGIPRPLPDTPNRGDT